MAAQAAWTFVSVLTEDECVSLYNKMAGQWGWSGTFFTRGDAATGTVDEEITDEEWRRVRDSYQWKYIPDLLSDRGWDLVYEAQKEAGLRLEF